MENGDLPDTNHERIMEIGGPGAPHLCECEFCGDDSPLTLSTHPVVAGRTQQMESYLVCAGCLPRLSTGTLDLSQVKRSAESGGDTGRTFFRPTTSFLL